MILEQEAALTPSKMKKRLSTFKESFKFKKIFLKIFLVEAVFFSLIYFLWILVTKFIAYKNAMFSPGQTTEQIKEFMVTAPPEELSAFLSQIKGYFFSVFGSFILFVILAILLFALSQGLIWHLIRGKKLTKKYYWRWLGLALVFGIFFGVTFFVYLFIKFIIILLIQSHVNWISPVSQTLNLIYLLAVLFIFFLASYHLADSGKVFKSIGEGFMAIKHKFGGIAWGYLFSLLVAGALTLVLYLVFRYVASLQLYLGDFNAVISLLFLAWLRLYLVKVLA